MAVKRTATSKASPDAQTADVVAVESKDRTETYQVEGPDGVVTVHRNIDTGESRVEGGS